MAETVEHHEISVSELLAVIRRSGLVDIETLKQALGGLDIAHCSAQDILSRLVEKELITPWQSRQLLKARWKGYRLGKYLLLDELGRGGMAKVFLARHQTLRSFVAIKVLSRARIQKASMIERFLREARAAAQISHPNIVRVFDVDAEDDRHYLVMEYIKGWSLQELVETEGVLSYERAADFTRQAAAGLSRAHEEGLIHRDIKPANLLVEEGKIVKISDFGLARVETGEEDGSLTMQHEEKVLGTADYIAPEQAVSSHHIDARADLYSLGYTLYFMLAGQPPFPSGRIVERLTKHCTMEPEGVENFRPDAPPGLLAILHKLTRKKPEERYGSAADVVDALERWLAEWKGAEQHGASLTLRSGNAARRQVKYSPPPTAPRSQDEEDLLTLAPEEDAAEVAAPRARAHAASDSESNAGSDAATDEPPPAASNLGDLDLLPDQSGVPDEESLESGSFPFSQLLDEMLDNEAEISGTPGASGSGSGLAGFPSDVHGSDVFGSSGSRNALHDTDASSVALPTHASGAHPKSQAEEPGFFTRLYRSCLRGEYPLWLLIGAGLILGTVLLFVAYSWLSSFMGGDVPTRAGE